VAAAAFFFAGKLRKGFSQPGKIKHRIVSESGVSTRRFEDDSIGTIRNDGQAPPGGSERQHAHEMSFALSAGLAPQLAQQLFDSLRVGGIFSRIARRAHTGSATERGDDQS